MLPLVGDRPPVVAEPGALEDRLNRAKRILDEIGVDRFFRSERIYLVYAGRYYAPASAWLVYWPIAQLTEKMPQVLPAEAVSYHLLAYRGEKASIIAFIEPRGENMLARIGDAARFTDTPLLAIAPPLPPVIEERYRGEELIVVEDEAPATLYTLLAAVAASKALEALRGIELRVKRYHEEIITLHTVVGDIRKEYKNILKELSELRYDIIASSPTMLPAAYMLRMYYETRYRSPVPVEALSSTLPVITSNPFVKNILITASGVEADMVREIESRAALLASGLRATSLIIGTDPLTAPLYGTLAASVLIEDYMNRG